SATDSYRCPGDQVLTFRNVKAGERVRVYQAEAATCQGCALRPRCTTGASSRRVHRSYDEAYLERVREYHATPAYQKAIRKRQVWVEPLFAEAKEWHGLRRFRLRGLEKVNGEALLIAAGQNLKRVLSRWGGGRRPWPSGAAGGGLPAAPPAPGSAGGLGRGRLAASRARSLPTPPSSLFQHAVALPVKNPWCQRDYRAVGWIGISPRSCSANSCCARRARSARVSRSIAVIASIL